ncbi:hypothetical protein E2542_SST28134 [Spatholobus suberectus]|nr:hypothetical protein E2542_SST28134 [Spatholobus suberectus]
MGTLGTKIPFLCGLVFLLMLSADSVCATRSNFPSMEQENNRKEASMMLMDSAKGYIPPSGPSHRGHDAPHFEGHFNNKSP